MIHEKKPENFDPKIEVVSCFVEHRDRILLLLRQDHKSEPNTWGVPAGKIEQNEDIIQAVIRETREETGIILGVSNIEYLGVVHVSYPNIDFDYHMSRSVLSPENNPDIVINPDEHKEHRWVTPQEALELDLIEDEDGCIRMHYDVE